MQIEREEKDYNFVVKKLTEQEKTEQEKARKKKIDSEEYRRGGFGNETKFFTDKITSLQLFYRNYKTNE